MQKLIAREYVLAGEVFIVLVKSLGGYPQLMLVSSEQVRHSGRKDDDSIDGIFVDAYGKATAYGIHTGAVWQKVDASNVIHLARHKNIGQLRGIGTFASSLNSMRDHKDVMLLEKKAQKAHSMMTLAFYRKGGEVSEGFMGGGTPVNASGVATTAASNKRLMNPTGGATVILDEGEKVEMLSGDRTTEGFARFVEMLMGEVCLSVSIPYSFLVSPDKLTGTGIRFALTDADNYFSSLQEKILDGAMNRIYGWVVLSLIQSGKLAAPAKGTGYGWEVSWSRPQKITVDTQRATNADIALLQNSLLSFEGYYSARGKDWKAELRQRAAEESFLNELADETGVSIGRLRALAAGSPTIQETDSTADPEQEKAKAA
jgi:capsid protein